MGAASMGVASMGGAFMGAASMGGAFMGVASMGAASMGAATLRTVTWRNFITMHTFIAYSISCFAHKKKYRFTKYRHQITFVILSVIDD